jgi:hypothetical protein
MRLVIVAIIAAAMLGTVCGHSDLNTMPIMESIIGYGNHHYTASTPVCEVYTQWFPGLVRLYQVQSPFVNNYDSGFTTDPAQLKQLLDTKCWVNTTAEMYVYPTHMTNTRALYWFSRVEQLVSGEDYGGEGIGDHMITTNPESVPDGYRYGGIIGFVPD